MATVRVDMQGFDDGRVLWWLEYDDVALHVTQVGCTNLSAAATDVTLARADGSRARPAFRVGAGQTLSVPVPIGAAQRVSLTLFPRNGRQRPDDISLSFRWPVP